jgi:hypothetical protein
MQTYRIDDILTCHLIKPRTEAYLRLRAGGDIDIVVVRRGDEQMRVISGHAICWLVTGLDARWLSSAVQSGDLVELLDRVTSGDASAIDEVRDALRDGPQYEPDTDV